MRRPLIISRNLRTADRLGINAAKNDVHAAPILRSAARSASSIRPQGSFHPNHLSRLLRLVTEFGAGIVEPKGDDKCPPFQRLYSALGINAVRFRRSEVKIHRDVRVGRRSSFTAPLPQPFAERKCDAAVSFSVRVAHAVDGHSTTRVGSKATVREML